MWPPGFRITGRFQWKLEKRFSEFLALLAAYTWSKQLDYLSYLNPIAYQVEHTLDPNDRPHHFSLASVYQLPVGRGKRLLPHLGRASNALIGGWQISGNYNIQSGTPIVFTTNLTWNGQDASIPRAQRTLNQWFNALIRRGSGKTTRVDPNGPDACLARPLN
jgi:hypothetical protein